MEVLTFDDNYTLEDFGMANARGNEQTMFGAITARSEKVPGRKGLLDFGNEIGAGTEKFPILVKSNNPIERSYLIRAFKNFLLDEYGYPRMIKIHKSTEPDVYYYGKISVAPTPELYSNAGMLNLEITNYNGVKYSKFEANEILWGSQQIDFQDGYLLGNTGSGANELRVTGNISISPTVSGSAVFPYLVLVGHGSDVVITSNGKSIQIGNFNGTLEIDCANFISYLNGAEKLIQMDKFQLVRGKAILISGSNMNFTLTNNFRDEL